MDRLEKELEEVKQDYQNGNFGFVNSKSWYRYILLLRGLHSDLMSSCKGHLG